MNSVDSLNSSLYFTAAANASKQAQKEKDKIKTEKTKKSSFTQMLEKNQQMEELAQLGLPPEIAGLNTEDAAVFLMDELDIAGDKLSEVKNQENLNDFKRKVTQFLRFVQKNSYEVAKIKLPPRLARQRVRVFHTTPFLQETRLRDPYFQIRIINENLDKLAKMVLEKHENNLNLLSKVDEIKGMLVDFFAV